MLIIELLHFLPLVLILGLISTPFLTKTIFKKNIIIKNLDPLLLVLCAIGICSGSNAHSSIVHLFDPCFGYAMVLMSIAINMTKFRTFLKKAS